MKAAGMAGSTEGSLAELMHVSWDLPGTIQPAWQHGRHPVLLIPHAMQTAL